MTAPVILAQLPLGKQTTLRVALTDGGRLVDLRACSPISATSSVLAPTGRGVALPVDQLGALIEALQQAQAKAGEMIGGDA